MNVNCWMHRWNVLQSFSFVVGIAIVAVGSALAQSNDVRFVEGLRARRLFDLAALHCREQLSKSQLDPLEQAELMGQLIRTYGEQAMHAAPAERAKWWQAAHDAAADFVRNHAEHPRILVVRVQDALVWCAEGELLRQEAEAARGDTAKQAAAALDVLRGAAKALERLDEDIAAVLPAAPLNAEGASLSADELFALRNHVRLELARVYRNRGFCYPEGDDRIAAISQALEPLKAALLQMPAEDPLAWRARLEQAICYRLLGSSSDAQLVLTGLISGNSPPELAAAIRAEEIRALLEAGKVDEAIAKATQQLPPSAEADADFVLARLEASIAKWQQASASNDPQRATEWREQAVSLTRFIEQRHGSYWGRRAEQLLLRSASAGSGAGDVEILRRQADDLWLQSRFPEAIAAYDAAADAAAGAGLMDDEFLARFRAALVVQKTGDLQGCLQRFQELALKLPTHPQSPAVHLEAIKVAIELARSDSKNTTLYEQLLLEHRDHWAGANTAHQLRHCLSKLYRHSQRSSEAIAVYTAIAPESVHALEALTGAQSAWLDELRHVSDANARAALIERAVEYFRRVAAATSRKECIAQAAISTSLILLEFAPARCGDALPLLEQASSQLGDDADAALRDEIESLIIAGMSMDSARQNEAAQRLEKWRSENLQTVLSLSTRLATISANLPEQQRRSLANLQLRLVERLRSTPLDQQAQTNVRRMEAMALAAVGDRPRALAAFKELTRILPRDGEIQIEYARLLERGGDTSAMEAALTQWSNVARSAEPRSDAWYEAKCGVANARIELGQAQQAAQALKYLLQTSPPAAGSIWERRVKELLARSAEK